MPKPESSLWDYLSGVLPLNGTYSRIESNDTAPGIPDVHYCIDGIAGFIELKIGDAPFGDRGLRKSQRDWIEMQVMHGGRVWILAQVGALCLLIPGKYWECFNQANLNQLDRLCAYKWTRPIESPTAALRTILKR